MDKSSIEYINNITFNNRYNCINGTLHPFKIAASQKLQCKTLDSIYREYDGNKVDYLNKCGYHLYQLFKHPEYKKYNYMFRNSSICLYFGLYMSFSNNFLPDEYLYVYNIIEVGSR